MTVESKTADGESTAVVIRVDGDGDERLFSRAATSTVAAHLQVCRLRG